MGCGLFRELDTLKQITKNEIYGMDGEESFIEYIKPLESSGHPSIRIEHADLYTVHIHPRERFDLVLLLFSSLGVMPEIPLALKKLFDAVLPEGTLFLSFWKDDDIYPYRLKL